MSMLLVRSLKSELLRIPDLRALKGKPFEIELKTPLPSRLRFYIFAATQHESERQVGTFRIQLTAGLEKAKLTEIRRFAFDRSGAIRPILVGFNEYLGIFILWDADVHDSGKGFAFSKGVQAPPDLVWQAKAKGVADGSRLLKQGHLELLVAARPEYLVEAIGRRVHLSNAALIAG